MTAAPDPFEEEQLDCLTPVLLAAFTLFCIVAGIAIWFGWFK
jgi:hypothetical protein